MDHDNDPDENDNDQKYHDDYVDDQDDGPRQPRWASPQCEGSTESCLQRDGQGHHARFLIHLSENLDEDDDDEDDDDDSDDDDNEDDDGDNDDEDDGDNTNTNSI